MLTVERGDATPTSETGSSDAAIVRQRAQREVNLSTRTRGAAHIAHTEQRNFVDPDASAAVVGAPPSVSAATASAASAPATTATATTRTATAASAMAFVPDERPLWRLLHDHRLADFDRQVEQIEHEAPSWRPSSSLTDERARQQRDADVAAALQGNDAVALRHVIALVPDAFGCAHIDRVWQAADVFARTGALGEVDALYRTVIPSCAPADNRIATLYRAQQQLPADRVDALIALEASQGHRDAQGEAAFERLRYQRAIAALGKLPPDSAQAANQLADVAQSIRSYRDGPAAALAGWIAHAQHDESASQSWFEAALTFSPENVDAKLGLAQIRIESRDYDAAQSLLDAPALREDPRARQARAQIALAHANDAYAARRYDQSLKWLDVAAREGLPATDSAVPRGWTLYAMGRYEQAAAAFRVRYDASHDDGSAEGLALSLHAMGKIGARTGASRGTPPSTDDRRIDAYLDALDAQTQYYRKQFVASKAALNDALAEPADPQRIVGYVPADLTGIDAPSLTGGLAWSDHIGAAGQGRLDTIGPELQSAWVHGTTQFSLQYRQLFINAGTESLDAGSPTSPRLGGSTRAEEVQASVADSTRIGVMPKLDWRLSLGGTQGAPSGFQPNGVGTVGQQTSWGTWMLYGGVTPVRDSLLSWRGMAWPEAAGNDRWGAVLRSSGGAQVRWQVAPHWNIGAAATGQWLTGSNVAGNEGVSVDLSAAYDLHLRGFDYLNIGPTMHYLSYRRNENFYDWGQGGYYSPQSSLSEGLALQWLTAEGRKTQIRASVEAGWNDTLQHSEACFPLGIPAGTSSAIDAMNAACTGSHDHGPYTSAEIAAVTRLSPRLQVGALVTANVTPGRDQQFGAAVFVRYFFAPRAAVFSSDLPSSAQQ